MIPRPSADRSTFFKSIAITVLSIHLPRIALLEPLTQFIPGNDIRVKPANGLCKTLGLGRLLHTILLGPVSYTTYLDIWST